MDDEEDREGFEKEERGVSVIVAGKVAVVMVGIDGLCLCGIVTVTAVVIGAWFSMSIGTTEGTFGSKQR